jgi:hypothetical protein
VNQKAKWKDFGRNQELGYEVNAPPNPSPRRAGLLKARYFSIYFISINKIHSINSPPSWGRVGWGV